MQYIVINYNHVSAPLYEWVSKFSPSSLFCVSVTSRRADMDHGTLSDSFHEANRGTFSSTHKKFITHVMKRLASLQFTCTFKVQLTSCSSPLSITTISDPCSWIIHQKSTAVAARGACVAMNFGQLGVKSYKWGQNLVFWSVYRQILCVFVILTPMLLALM